MTEIVLLGRGLNLAGWEPIETLLVTRGLRFFRITRHEELRHIDRKLDLGVLLGYSHIVPADCLKRPKHGFILFHSSDLPQGRGWAPIYNTITRKLPLTQTLLFATANIDSGPIIAKASHPLEGKELEQEVRYIDDQLTLALLKDALEPILSGDVRPCDQNEAEATRWPRRCPADSAVDARKPLEQLIDHIRALPPQADAFFDYQGRRFYITLKTRDEPKSFSPELITITRNY